MRVFLFIVLLSVTVASCQQSETNSGTQQTETSAAIASIKTVQLNVKGMTCEGCENTIESALADIDGIVSAEALHTKGLATVSFDSTKVNTDKISQTINKLGYEVIN